MPEGAAEALQGRLDELVDVGDDALLEFSLVLFALLEEHFESRVALVEDRRLAAKRPLGARQRVLHRLLLGDVRAEEEAAPATGDAAGHDAEQQVACVPPHVARDLQLTYFRHVATPDRLCDDRREVVGHAARQHLLPRPLEEGQGVFVGVHVGAVLVHLHGRARQAEEDPAQLVGLAAYGLRRALACDIPDGADHVRRPSAAVGQQDGLVGHRGPGTVAAPEAVLAAERRAVEDALRQGLHGRVVIVQVDAVEPALDAARERARRADRASRRSGRQMRSPPSRCSSRRARRR